jgi:hypothetical protein
MRHASQVVSHFPSSYVVPVKDESMFFQSTKDTSNNMLYVRRDDKNGIINGWMGTRAMFPYTEETMASSALSSNSFPQNIFIGSVIV